MPPVARDDEGCDASAKFDSEFAGGALPCKREQVRVRSRPVLLTASLAVVACLAVAAHHIINRLQMLDNRLLSTVLGALTLVAINFMLVVLAPSTPRSSNLHAVGVACLAAFVSSYWYMLAMEMQRASPDRPMHRWYIIGSVTVGSLGAAASGRSYCDVWVAARCIHASHGLMYLLCIAYAIMSTQELPPTLPPNDTPHRHAPIYVVVHGALAAGLTAPARQAISEWASHLVPELARPSDRLPAAGRITPLHASSPPSLPALQPTPAAPPLPLLSPRSRSLPARLGALAPVRFSLALLVVVAAHMLRGPSSAPGGIHTSLGAAGFAVLAVANLAQASPRFVARAMALLIMCCPTLRLVSVLVRSPEEMARDLDKFAGAGRCLLTFCAACGAAFGALPPSALPPTRKLLAVGYCACVQMCVGFILHVRTGDERALSFYLLLVLLPFLASFFAAQRGTRPHRPTAAVQLEMGCPLSTPPLKIAVGVCCGLMGGPASCVPSPSPSSVLAVVHR
mmetsp:Transcript_14368/g.42170  ORF Transcript_14368/g.42170 Transcript_14368/m.42170 type:complete len:510 (+) Transcript_14368:158-1687(+)